MAPRKHYETLGQLQADFRDFDIAARRGPMQEQRDELARKPRAGR